MGKLRPFLAVACLLTLGSAGPVWAGAACYQRSNSLFFQQVVEIIEGTPDPVHGHWTVRLRLRGRTSPQGHAMICNGNACDPRLPLREGIFWWEASAVNDNVLRVIAMENGNCTDVTFYIEPKNAGETLLVDLAALFEEGYFLPPSTWRPRWSDGVLDLSSLDGTKSHCQDGEPRGAVCL